MALWGVTSDQNDQPKWVSKMKLAPNTTVKFIGHAEAWDPANRDKGIKGAGWWLDTEKEYGDGDGGVLRTSHKVECLVALPSVYMAGMTDKFLPGTITASFDDQDLVLTLSSLGLTLSDVTYTYDATTVNGIDTPENLGAPAFSTWAGVLATAAQDDTLEFILDGNVITVTIGDVSGGAVAAIQAAIDAEVPGNDLVVSDDDDDLVITGDGLVAGDYTNDPAGTPNVVAGTDTAQVDPTVGFTILPAVRGEINEGDVITFKIDGNEKVATLEQPTSASAKNKLRAIQSAIDEALATHNW